MSNRNSIRAEKIPPRKTKITEQMVDIKGFPLTTEQGAPLVTEKDSYLPSEYSSESALGVVIDSESYRISSKSTLNVFSKGEPAALPIVEQFPEQSETSRSLLGIDRQTTQQSLFSNVSSYGLDPKDWKITYGGIREDETNEWWLKRPATGGNYFMQKYYEDDKNSSIVLVTYPSPFLPPDRPSPQDLLLGNTTDQSSNSWGQYLNGIVALYLIEYMANNFTDKQKLEYNLIPMLSKYPMVEMPDGSKKFNKVYWDSIWLDIKQSRLGSSSSSFPIIPNGKAYNFNNSVLLGWRSNPLLWGSSNSIINESTLNLPTDLDVSWNNFFFSTTRVYYPFGTLEDRGHYRIKTNPTPFVWEKYHGLRWSELRSDLKSWEFTVHPNSSTVTQVEKDLKLPYFILDSPLIADTRNNTFTNSWPSQTFGQQINLPTNSNKVGGLEGIYSEINLKSIRSFRYQPGRISGFTYGVKVSEIGAGPGTVLEFGIENETDAYMFRLTNGSLFSIIRRSTMRLEDTSLIEDAGYLSNTKVVKINNVVQYETTIEQKNMNGDPLSGEGGSGYFLNPDTVTMYKIEFGWYGAIGARFYAYVPVGNGDCRWVTMHTFVIENQLGKPCLADPFFYFKYRLKVQDSSTIRINQNLSKYGASYYIDGYDEGTLYSQNTQSRVRYLPSPGFSETKTNLNAIDWVTVMGIKPKTSLVNRFGTQFLNRKEIFPERLLVRSQQDCEIKIVRQKGCPEWAYSHQEGYNWNLLPEERRVKGKFVVTPFYNLDYPELGISSSNPPSYSAIATYNTNSEGFFRSPYDALNWSEMGDQVVRVVGEDMYGLCVHTQKDFENDSLTVKLVRASYSESSDITDRTHLSSNKPLPDAKSVNLPFTYPLAGVYLNGYDIEFDYFRRDQILLSSIDVVSSEFYIFWTGYDNFYLTNGLTSKHIPSLRMGFVWPDVVTPTHPLYSESFSESWGIEPSPSYDQLTTFYEGLPYDFAFEYKDNSLYVETDVYPAYDTFNLEYREFTKYYITELDRDFYKIPGPEGGSCRGLYCKAGRELRDNVSLISETDQTTSITSYYLVDNVQPWPNLKPDSYTVTLTQGSVVRSVTTTGGTVRTVGEVIQYLLPIGTSLPLGISTGSVNVSFNLVYIATIGPDLKVKRVLASKIAPGEIPFIRPFIQGRQGLTLGGVWVGQKTVDGIKVEPLTPHRCTLSISDTGVDSHGQWSTIPETDGAVKSISTYTDVDKLGFSTSPTIDPQENSLNTRKSIHSSRKKCGSFLSSGESTNSAGVFTPSDYPVRWLTSDTDSVLATYYVSADTSTEINMKDVFNVSAESITNNDDGNLATFFIARSLNNHSGSNNEIYLSLNYTEQ
jgi:hypothetical protein